jgi:hypothetical protein
MKYTFDADGPTRKQVQYYEMMGHRGIWADGWKATTLHGPIARHGDYDNDVWQLFHVEEDRSEAHDLAEQYPDKLEELKALWFEEANKYDVLPLSDHGSPDLPPGYTYHVPVRPSGQYTYYPNTASVPEACAAGTLNRSFKILAEVEFTPDTQGVIMAQGSRFGGHALFVKNGKLCYVYNFLGIPPEQQLIANAPTSGTHLVGVEFTNSAPGRTTSRTAPPAYT